MRGFFLSVFFKIWSVEGSSFEKAPPTTLLPSILHTISFLILSLNKIVQQEVKGGCPCWLLREVLSLWGH